MNYRHLMALAATVAFTFGMEFPEADAHSFSYNPPGQLTSGSGRGRVDNTVYVPNMRFPIKDGPAYANSQVYGHGGYLGPGGGQCNSNNYSYPWSDNYCETRSWSVPMCPGGTGHQGQDIRPSTCENSKHVAVASVAGTITNVGTYSVSLTSADGTRHRYLHMSHVAVRRGQNVTRGQVMGRVSNAFGGTPTTIHLHYDIYRGGQYIPTYMSLVRSYEALMGANQPAPTPPPPPQPGSCGGVAAPGAEGAFFVDFLPSQVGYQDAIRLYNAGITHGCKSSPRMFCPNCPTTRRHMAMFLARAARLDVSNPPTHPTFSDVAPGSMGYEHVEAIAAAGITNGCGAGKFCPDQNITRGQAAAMIRRTLGWPVHRVATATFSDAPKDHMFHGDIETLKQRCVTNGCGSGGNYCVNDELTRGQAAAFISRAFNLEGSNSCAEPATPVRPAQAPTQPNQPAPIQPGSSSPDGTFTNTSVQGGCALAPGAPGHHAPALLTLLGMFVAASVRRRHRS